MAEFTPKIVEDVVAACTEGAEEASSAFSRALDTEITLSVGEAGTWDAEKSGDDFAGAGLAVVLSVGEQAALILLPESSELLPSWYAEPDPTGESKLMTLAQELGMLLLPEDFMPEDFKAAGQADLKAAIERGKPVEQAAMLQLPMASGEKSASLTMIWPLADATAILEVTQKEEDESEQESDSSEQADSEKPAPAESGSKNTKTKEPTVAALSFGNALEHLPSYTRSLLKINMRLSVTLAEKKQNVADVLTIGPGSILQFDKMCEEMLDLEIGGHKIAKGEAVKVGDKFGLRITSVILPDEKHVPLRAS